MGKTKAPGKASQGMPVRKWAAGRGALFLIAGLFAASATLRLGAGPGRAIAQGVAALNASAQTPDKAMPSQPQPPLDDILAALAKRSAELDEKERRLEERSVALAAAQARISADMKALKKARDELAATMARAQTAAEDDLKRLTSVYENMKPKQASSLFEKMNPEFAAGFIGRMRPDAAAQIMAGMSPESAYAISVILAGRNANAPVE